MSRRRERDFNPFDDVETVLESPQMAQDAPNAAPGGNLRDLALRTLEAVCGDSEAPAAAKAAAARTILETVGALGRNQQVINETAEKDLATMSARDLEREIQRLESSIRSLGTP